MKKTIFRFVFAVSMLGASVAMADFDYGNTCGGDPTCIAMRSEACQTMCDRDCFQTSCSFEIYDDSIGVCEWGCSGE
jgi:hypothetical protein